MAITDHASYKGKADTARQQLSFTKTVSVSQRFASTWPSAVLAGTAPTTAVVPTSTTVGALVSDPPIADPLVAHRLIRIQGTCAIPGRYVLYDRLSHQGGLSAIVTTAQTTNLPTAALTRYPSGQGVLAALEIYTLIGTTATTVTASYTNEAGTSGRTSVAVTFGGASFNAAQRFFPLPLQVGDTGVRAVASVTVLASTGTAGNFGVTLYKPLLSFLVEKPGQFLWDSLEDGGGYAPEILSGACLGLVSTSSVAASLAGAQDMAAQLIIAEDD